MEGPLPLEGALPDSWKFSFQWKESFHHGPPWKDRFQIPDSPPVMTAKKSL